MRNRSAASSEQQAGRLGNHLPSQFDRAFEPADLDIDHWAETIRKLLRTSAEPASDSDLLSTETGATHVLGVDGKP